MNNFKLLILALLVTSFSITGCKDKEKFSNLTLNIAHNVDGEAVVFDEFNYNNEAGYSYSITHIEYYISEIQLTGEDGIYQDNNFYYVNFEDPTTMTIRLSEVPYDKYSRITFKLGLDDTYNFDGGLPTTTENNGMVWPEPLGGGYHFMKFEGNFVNANSDTEGFGMHLGKDGNYSDCYKEISLDIDDDIASLDLSMNMNEWFRNPETFDFATDGSFIMPNDASLQKLSANGDDVFSGN